MGLVRKMVGKAGKATYTRLYAAVSSVTKREASSTYLAGNTSGDDHNLDTLESLVELVGSVALDLSRDNERGFVTTRGTDAPCCRRRCG